MKKLYDLGVKITLNSDNMTITGLQKMKVDIIEEIKNCIHKMNFTFDDIKKLMKNAIESRFGNVD